MCVDCLLSVCVCVAMKLYGIFIGKHIVCVCIFACPCVCVSVRECVRVFVCVLILTGTVALEMWLVWWLQCFEIDLYCDAVEKKDYTPETIYSIFIGVQNGFLVFFSQWNTILGRTNKQCSCMRIALLPFLLLLLLLLLRTKWTAYVHKSNFTFLSAYT